MRRFFRRFALAATFLTVAPLPAPIDAEADDLQASMAWYPLVGLGLGAAGWGAYFGLTQIAPALVSAAVVIVLLELATRALHLDGLMDTCDGNLSGISRERALEIMKDSRSGAMGVFGAIAVLLVKVAALSSLSRWDAALPLICGWALARGLAVFDVSLFPYARREGLGEPFARAGRSPALVALASVVAILVVAALVSGRGGGGAPPPPPARPARCVCHAGRRVAAARRPHRRRVRRRHRSGRDGHPAGDERASLPRMAGMTTARTR
jgi:adenosylcobinamide-GDP ribazoletransferase